MKKSTLTAPHPLHPGTQALYPHCLSRDRDLPTLENIAIDETGPKTNILAITFTVQCECGAQWDLRKKIQKNQDVLKGLVHHSPADVSVNDRIDRG